MIFLSEIQEQINNLSLYGYIQGTDRLIANNKIRLKGYCSGDVAGIKKAILKLKENSLLTAQMRKNNIKKEKEDTLVSNTHS